MKKNYYDILGIQKTADEKEIKRAFRKLAKKYHPDTNQGNAQAQERFKEINEAYNVLSDPKKKELYDKYGDMGLQEGFDAKAYEAYKQSGFGGSGFGRAGMDGDGTYREVHFDGDLNDLFSSMFGGGRGAASAGFGGSSGFGGFGRRRSNAPMKGEDVKSQISISFNEAAFGCDKTLSMNGPDGKKESLKVHIPAGIDEGQKVRLKGKGYPGTNGGVNGDLYLQVHITPRSGFERKGQDVYVNASIPYTTAVLGGEVIVPTLTGNVACKIRPGTSAGSKIRLKGKGIVSMKNPSVHGDEYVVIQIDVPKRLTPEQRKKLEEYAALTDPGAGTGSGTGRGRGARADFGQETGPSAGTDRGPQPGQRTGDNDHRAA